MKSFVFAACLRTQIRLASILLLSAAILTACSSAPNPEDAEQTDESGNQKSTSALTRPSGDDDLIEREETPLQKESVKASPKSTAKSTAFVPTNKFVDGVEFHQQNEFLGTTVVKLSKLGVRLESPSITCILPLGKTPTAYNAQNGSCLKLTYKSTAILAGGVPTDGKLGKQKLIVISKDKIAGVNCIHYKYYVESIDPKTKQKSQIKETQVWGTKDLKIPDAVLKECSKMLMMPPEAGFPLKVMRIVDTAELEKRQKKGLKPQADRVAVDTSQYKQTKLDVGEFAPLEGFKPVTDEMQFMMSSDDSELAGGALDDLEKE